MSGHTLGKLPLRTGGRRTTWWYRRGQSACPRLNMRAAPEIVDKPYVIRVPHPQEASTLDDHPADGPYKITEFTPEDDELSRVDLGL